MCLTRTNMNELNHTNLSASSFHSATAQPAKPAQATIATPMAGDLAKVEKLRVEIVKRIIVHLMSHASSKEPSNGRRYIYIYIICYNYKYIYTWMFLLNLTDFSYKTTCQLQHRDDQGSALAQALRRPKPTLPPFVPP